MIIYVDQFTNNLDETLDNHDELVDDKSIVGELFESDSE